jgi:signal transduction histidine kinase
VDSELALKIANADLFGVLEVTRGGAVRDANGRALRTLAMTRRSLPFLRLSTMFPDDAPPDWVMEAVEKGTAAGPTRVEMATVDEGRATVDLAIIPTDDGSIFFLYDIGRTATESAEPKASLRERMLWILAHDLRSPLAAVSAIAQRIARMADVPPSLADLNQRLVWSTERMRRMLDDLVEVAASGSGGSLPYQAVDGDLGDIASRVVDELRAETPSREIVLDSVGDLHGKLDPDRIAQAVSNLIRHALQQSEGAIEVRLQGQERSLRVEVSTAHGERKKTPTGGRGVGLYVAQQIIAAHGGLLEVQNKPDGFTVAARLAR